eukprot:gene17286-18908_t
MQVDGEPVKLPKEGGRVVVSFHAACRCAVAAGALLDVFGIATVPQGGDTMQVEDVDSDHPSAHEIEVKWSEKGDRWDWAPVDKKRRMLLGKREVFDHSVRARYVKVGYGDESGSQRQQAKLPSAHVGLLVKDEQLVPARDAPKGLAGAPAPIMLRGLVDILERVQLDNDDLQAENEELREQIATVRNTTCCGVM